MAQPLFMRLKARAPDTRLDVFAPAWVAPILTRMPEVDDVLENPFGHGELRLAERWRLGRRLKSRGYDQAIVLPNSSLEQSITTLKGFLKKLDPSIPKRFSLP
ncbi:MAG: lipopolysaccharide heptosyltransferase II, partial [Burkholderiales bacterium]